jgi:hypothetical protein
MDAAAILAALNTVEQDHHLVLEKVRALKELVGSLLDPAGVDVHQVLGRLREVHKFFSTQLLSHLDEEEVTLFPLLERDRPTGAELADRLRREHEDIRRKLEEFENCLYVAGQLEDGGLPRAVLRDVLTLGWELWVVLDNHAHAETRGLQQCLHQHLGQGEGGR